MVWEMEMTWCVIYIPELGLGGFKTSLNLFVQGLVLVNHVEQNQFILFDWIIPTLTHLVETSLLNILMQVNQT